MARTIPSLAAPSAASAPAGVRTLPAVDALLGTVEFRLGRSWCRWWCTDPAALGAALDRAVAPPRWHAASATLAVAVAATGRRSGVELHFRLHPARTPN
ncbi:hypothetical protein ACQCSX_17860 [Pseudarthrobacter sp. P1]|uniref:hypothetical protein n=1 Tax=Pseudarthrobacter sp. P1 TaxID=3418418 RepID=UPI003CE7F1E0